MDEGYHAVVAIPVKLETAEQAGVHCLIQTQALGELDLDGFTAVAIANGREEGKPGVEGNTDAEDEPVDGVIEGVSREWNG